MIVANLCTVLPVTYIGKAICTIGKILEDLKKGEVSERHKYEMALYIGFIMILPVVGGFLKYGMRKILITASRTIEFDMKNQLFAHYQKLSLSFYERKNTGDLITRLTEDISMIRQYTGPGIMYLLNLFIMIVISGIQMIRLDKTLSGYMLFPLPVLLTILYLLSVSIYKKSMILQACQSVVFSFVQDTFAGIRTVKSFVLEEYFKQEHHRMVENYCKKNLNLAFFNAVFFCIILWFTGLSQLLILYIGGKRYLGGEISDIGLLAEFFVYLNLLNWPLISISWILSILQRAEASQNRIDEFLKIAPELVRIGQVSPKIQGAIKVDKLSFSHAETNLRVLKDVSFEIQAGERVAIIGESGSGKTTLAHLLMRLYKPDKGTIYIDDFDLKDLNIKHFREHTAYLPQESFLFSDTIHNNIAFGKPTASKQEVYKAARKAMIEKDILCFKKTYDTLIGEQGVMLSGGQKQRLCIARALIKDTKILLFDDSLSAIDQYTKKKILEKIKCHQKKQTFLFITHDINIAKNTDKIFVLEKGSLRECGNHKELILQKGYYYELYQKQYDKSRELF